MSFAEDGTPSFGNTLASRPKSRGDSYYHVLFDGSRPVLAVLVLVVGENRADWSQPVTTIFRWMGKGFDVGAKFAESTLKGDCVSSKDWPTIPELIFDGFVCAAIGVAGIAITTTGGFMIGSAISLPDFAAQFDRSLDPTRERIVMAVRLSYDELSRLKEYSFEIPDETAWRRVVTTRCLYPDARRLPVDCTVDSASDKASRKLHTDI